MTRRTEQPRKQASERPDMQSIRWRKKLVVLALSSLLALVLGEALVRVARPGFPGYALPEIQHQPSPEVGYTIIPNQEGYTAASRVNINSLGFRGPEVAAQKGDRFRILCLGDSITFGYGVADDETYPLQLQVLLNEKWPGRKVDCINTGVQAYYAYQELDLLKLRGIELRPDVVVWCLYFNDLGIRPADGYSRPTKNKPEQAAGWLRDRAPWLYVALKNSALMELGRLVYLSRKESEGGRAQRILRNELSPADEQEWIALEDDLTTFKGLAEERGFLPIVVTVPRRQQVIEDFPESAFPARVLHACDRVGLANIDFLADFQESLKSGVDPYLPWDNHLSPAGHEIIARQVAEWLDSVAD